MAEILITGLEMPKKGEILTIEIGSNGQVNKVISRDLRDVDVAKAQELPHHGNLIEQDKALTNVTNLCSDEDTENLKDAIMMIPVVVEASK